MRQGWRAEVAALGHWLLGGCGTREGLSTAGAAGPGTGVSPSRAPSRGAFVITETKVH